MLTISVHTSTRVSYCLCGPEIFGLVLGVEISALQICLLPLYSTHFSDVKQKMFSISSVYLDHSVGAYGYV